MKAGLELYPKDMEVIELSEMRALSLFSGRGGVDLAAEAAGIRTVAMCERDPFCRAVLRKFWPLVPIYEDITKLRGSDMDEKIDVIHGGPPCQPVSVAGRRRGKEDERYLWGEVYRVVGDLMPRFLVLENVPGILSIAGDEICQTLDGIGYNIGICQFEAACVGAPHRRMRVFFVGHSKHDGSFAATLAGSAGTDEGNDKKGAFGAAELEGTGGRGNGNALEDAGFGMRERRSIRGAFHGERGEEAPSFAERPGCPFMPFMADAQSERRGHGYDRKNIGKAYRKIDSFTDAGLLRGNVSHAESRRREQGAKNPGGYREGGEQRTWDRPACSCTDFSDADDQRELQQAGRFGKFGRRSCDICELVSHSDRERRQEQQSPLSKEGERAALGSVERHCRRLTEPGLGGMAPGTPCWLDEYWLSEPDIPRIAKGVKNRVARLRALGNCVVPAQIYPIFRALVEVGSAMNCV
jgi:site-specific DNA-cytosine methylase